MDADHMRERLSEERDRLETLREQYAGLREESEDEGMQELSSVDQHQADVGTETFDREKDFSILEEVEGELTEIERALRRLDDGSYGTCEACGKPIPEERLEAMPASRFCIDDQARAEHELRRSAATTPNE